MMNSKYGFDLSATTAILIFWFSDKSALKLLSNKIIGKPMQRINKQKEKITEGSRQSARLKLIIKYFVKNCINLSDRHTYKE